jgi:16S rRNA (cytosine967-C5)-methyltransferase
LDLAREAALKILYEVNEKGAYSNIALNKCFSAKELNELDRAFATELVYGTVKWRLTLDYAISSYSDIKLKKMSPWILNILRLGFYQILFLSRVPVSAVCNTSVQLAGRYGHKASAGFVNAVLRKAAQKGGAYELPPRGKDPAEYLSIKYSYPRWLAEKFISLFGEEFAESLLEAGNGTPELTVRTNTLKVTQAELLEKLTAEGVEAVPGKFAKEAVILKNQGSVAALSSFKEGFFQVQDESSMLPAAVLDPKPGEKVLDACSAPGGKATHMAQLMGNTGKIVARDIHEHKIKLIEDAAKRLGIGILQCELQDAARLESMDEGAFDRVLLDAPCTGLGIIRRKPDIKWARETMDVESITALQKSLLQTVSRSVKPGGVMVYSTCTILPDENESIVKDFLERNQEFEADDIVPFLPDGLAAHAKGCMLQTYPNRDGIDGFFMARLRRKGQQGQP